MLLNARVADVVAETRGRLGTFGHGYTASGHPVATAVALENLRLIDERGLIERTPPKWARCCTRSCRPCPAIRAGGRGARGVGLIAGVELVADKATRQSLRPARQGRQLR